MQFAGSLLLATAAWAQQAEVSGFIKDPADAGVANARITIQNVGTNTKQSALSNGEGLYLFSSLPAGSYRATVEAQGFQTKVIEEIRLNVEAKVTLNVALEIGSTSQSVTVNGSGINVNTTDASVSTIVDRQFVENIPLNGRSFQSLLTLVPGVSVVPSQGVGLSGELSVNGQRTEANYFTVDGVSANTGTVSGETGLGHGSGYSGSVPGLTALGTTQSLVSIDALQEFRATTSTYSAEYGRTPGGQFSFTTRSGANDWHGSLFEYFRNDALDATNWFDNADLLPKQAERQNDFGGTFGGPVRIPKLYNGRNRTFFFVSYEGLRLRAPQPAIITAVPTVAVRQQAPAVLQPFLNAFPLPNGADLGNGTAYFTSGYSSPSSLDATSVRIDHSFSDTFKIFGRFSDSPSSVVTRSVQGLSERDSQTLGLKTAIVGSTNIFTPRLSSDLRFNATVNTSSNAAQIDSFGGAMPLSLDALPEFMGANPGWLFFRVPGTLYPTLGVSPSSSRQRQINVIETMNWSAGRHNLKWGVDYRRLATRSPLPSTYTQVGYSTEAQILANQPSILRVFRSNGNMEPVYTNFSAFVQDEWKVSRALSLSLGLRWDVNPAPRDEGGNQPYTVTQITDLATTAVASKGTALWKTTYNNFAPRLGIAYRLRQMPDYETVLRAGAGVFYDAGNTQASQGYFYGIGVTGTTYLTSGFPLTQAQLQAIPTPNANPPYSSNIVGFDPNLKLPYTVQWNVAFEQRLGARQSFTVSYVGSDGRRLLSQFLYSPGNLGNPNFLLNTGVYSLSNLYLTTNGASSSYNALQTQFQRQLANGLQLLLSYTWSHSIDDASSNFALNELLRGSSDFDIRHNFQAALTYNLPGKYRNRLLSATLRDWAIDTRAFARSALPVNVIGTTATDPGSGADLEYQPNLILGQPLYLADSHAPGDRRINSAVFQILAAGKEGNLGRNALRGFDAVQADIALRREFGLAERARLEFRAEALNIFNHPNFGAISTQLSDPRFGRATSTLNSQLGGVNPLYQIGGPRSLQLALKLKF
ncbi:MAG TPA: TonB-dependent receptor [Bryobacteraceae bacterium]|nr:TonB-dependent receptor [Bryobacteraceae bacterium]